MATRRRSGDLEPLLDYLQNPSPTTSLVFVFSAADGAARRDPAGEESAHHEGAGEGRHAGGVHRPRRRQGPCALGGRACQGRRARDRRPGRDEAARTGGRRSGRVRADVEKLLLFAAGAGRDHRGPRRGHRRHARAPRRRLGAGARARAGDAAAALRELQAALDNGGVPFQILGQIGYAIRTPPPRGRFPARRVPAAVDALFRTDVAMKSSGGDPRILLERLIVELCG